MYVQYTISEEIYLRDTVFLLVKRNRCMQHKKDAVSKPHSPNKQTVQYSCKFLPHMTGKANLAFYCTGKGKVGDIAQIHLYPMRVFFTTHDYNAGYRTGTGKKTVHGLHKDTYMYMHNVQTL